MHWLEFISSMTKALAWPVVVVVALLLFRDPIARRIPQLRRLKAGTGGVELEWVDDKLNEAKAELGKTPELAGGRVTDAAAILEARAIVAGPPPSIGGPTTFAHDIGELAEASPSAAVLEAYRRLEEFLRKTLALQNPQGSGVLVVA